MKFSKRYRKIIICVMLLGGIPFVSAQEEGAALVSYIYNAPEKINAGEQFEISVVFDIQPGWYVYAPVVYNANQGKIVTKVTFKLPNGIKFLGSLELPEGGYGTYSGTGVTMTQKFQVVKEVTKGKHIIVANIVYQTCNDYICYPPVREKEDIVITVTL
ncbi:hypothetical protein JYT50_00905 [bacterium AH-315-A23]|nr:hypothetical protein [bacterium AH-315-A23]